MGLQVLSTYLSFCQTPLNTRHVLLREAVSCVVAIQNEFFICAFKELEQI